MTEIASKEAMATTAMIAITVMVTEETMISQERADTKRKTPRVVPMAKAAEKTETIAVKLSRRVIGPQSKRSSRSMTRRWANNSRRTSRNTPTR